MAFISDNLKVLAGGTTPSTQWVYSHPTDTVDAITGTGYFNDARGVLNVGDRIVILGTTGSTTTVGQTRVTNVIAANVALSGWSAAAGQAAAPAGGTGAAAGGYDTAVNRDAMIALVNQMRTVLVAHGLMKGAA
jgi:hypothetical protein